MKTSVLIGLSIIAGMVFGNAAMLGAATPESNYALRKAAQKTMGEGNFKDAYQQFRKLALDPDDNPKSVGDDLKQATKCLQRLNRVNEIDAFREAVIEVHKGNWRLLYYAAQNYMHMHLPHHGYIVDGEFHRGDKRGGGRVVNAFKRDRVRALQLMADALPLAMQDDNHRFVGDFLLAFAQILLKARGHNEAWRLQYLTNLDELPDYEPGWGYYSRPKGAPVDADGNPIYYHVPKSFEEAKNDGERWRWCLAQATKFKPESTNNVGIVLAGFLRSQFGVQTMAHHGWRFGRMQIDDSKEDTSGRYALHTLAENETIARLATGIKRFTLPDEFNFIKIYQDAASRPRQAYGEHAIQNLAQIFENRRQYPKAADYWRKCFKVSKDQCHKDRLEQIVKNWGRFEPIMTQPAGKGATVEYRFRNGKAVELTAHEINVEKLLDDVKAYLKSNTRKVDRRKINVGNIGYRLVNENQKKYIGRRIANWRVDLEPREKHFDKRITITTPLQKPGAYLLTAKMKGGNTNSIVIWLSDTAIIKKPLPGKTYYYVADAVTGKPVAKANVEFFGWKRVRHDKPPRHEIVTTHFAEFTDADGQVIVDLKDQPNNYQWLITARTKEGRFAYLGFTGVWHSRHYDRQYNATKVFTITDRPVYRPKQKVHYKFWVRHAQYDMGDRSDFAGQKFNIEIRNPKGEKILTKTLKADAYGGMADELELPADATLGVYRMIVKQGNRHLGGGSFRVEEYKKPEFEVIVEAPTEPVMLGEKITATIKAKYYFGSPVANAKVKYKVMRTDHSQRWYPIRPWDWFYGPGYWWFSYDYPWYPGWKGWGCLRPIAPWWPRGHQPPEIVAEQEVEIGEDGTVKVVIDTAVTKAVHGDCDHKYSITAEVIDRSRRTIVGTGNVLVAREPFKVYTWVDRGYYRVGDTIHANFDAHTIAGKPVKGIGKLTLLRISYKDGEPVETPVQTWRLDTNTEGRARQQIVASRAGQYRLSYKLTDSKEHTIEGGHLFTVIGEGFDGSQFRFNHLELIPDKADYAPGDKVRLQINTDRSGGAVLLFLRPANGVYLPPKIIHLDGKSTVYEIEVTKKDMPNFFVEAVTVADARVHTETKEIVVPPEKRVLTVDIEPSSETYKPGERAKVKIRLKDFFGKPFVGSTVVAIYDKSLEYISGGSNVPEIKAFFWKWRRRHHPQTESNLGRYFHNLVAKGAKAMNNLGVFGATVADEIDKLSVSDESTFGRSRSNVAMFSMSGGMGRMGGGGGMMLSKAASAPMDSVRELGDKEEAWERKNGSGPGGDAAMAQPTVRKKFADTALWVAALTTDKDGTAEVELDMPENLTTWRIKVWGLGHGTRVGEGCTDVVTRKDLIIRMQAPRFFTQTDEVVLSANVHNYLKTKKSVKVALELDGKMLTLITVRSNSQTKEQWHRRLAGVAKLKGSGHRRDAGATDLHATDLHGFEDSKTTFTNFRQVEIDPNGEARIDWRVKVLDEGEAVITMKAITDEESDAMEMRFPCYIHGMLKTDSYSGSIRPKQTTGKFTVNVPERRRPEQSRLEVRYSPTLAGAMVDALPYLVEYPYGCTEQTLNRFLPTVITQKILLEMGLDLEAIEKKQTNLNAQEIGEDQERAKQWKRYKRNPVFDQAEVSRMVKEGVKRLTEMQLSDGGWGWFSGWGERSWPHTTAYVVHGLQIAQANDVALVPGMLEKGVGWLKRYQNEQVQKLQNALVKPKPKKPYKHHCSNLDAFVYMVLADADIKNAEMRDFLYRDRTKLAVYGLAMYGIALKKQNEKDKLAMVMRNISQYVVTDDENQTAWLNLPGGYWWCWYGSEYEAHAYYLKLLCRTDPKGELAPRLVKYLLNNRKHATYWNSTRDTALCVEAMADFIRASGEDKPDMTVEVYLDGKLQKAVEITPKNLFMFDNKLIVEGAALEAGPHVVELRRKGAGPLYYNGYMTNFTLEDFITKAGLEIKVNRKYYKLKRVDKTIKAAGSRGQAVDRKVEKYQRIELPNLSTLKSGELVEVELIIDSKNDYEYVVFEDLKPAGFEPVDLRSGYTGNALGAYVEFRDRSVNFFARRVARGKHSVSYRMRAEIPGRFSALPTRAWAMYAPELKANSDEIKLKVED